LLKERKNNMAFSQDFIDTTIGNVQLLHGRFCNELCNVLKRHTGERTLYDDMVNQNNHIGWAIDILYDYDPYGNSTLNDLYNSLTEEDLQIIINYCYRVLNKYGSEIFMPTDRNIYQ